MDGSTTISDSDLCGSWYSSSFLLGGSSRVGFSFGKSRLSCCMGNEKRDTSQSYRPMHAGDDFIGRAPIVPCDEDGFPEGWLKRMGDRVKVVEWAPQIKILDHSATGLFVSHCGWNSLTECFTIAGVPIVGVPFLTDQPMNADMMEHRLRIGCNLWKSATHGIIDCYTVSSILRQTMTDSSLVTRESAMKKLNEQRWSIESGNAIRLLKDFYHESTHVISSSSEK